MESRNNYNRKRNLSKIGQSNIRHEKPDKPDLTKKKVKIYNNSKLLIDKSNTLVICDWDDTLFPTSWVNDKRMDLTDIKSRYKYTRYFDYLDRHLSNTIKKIKKNAYLMIVTNATLQWIAITLTVLPKTKKLLKNVPVVSARESFQSQCSMQDWKKYTFRAELQKEGRRHYNNIISIGDANYEHRALVSLYNWGKIPHKYLKSIKFEKSIDCTNLFNQVKLIGEHIPNIIDAQRHLDLTIDTIKK
jgi:hypothetical protein